MGAIGKTLVLVGTFFLATLFTSAWAMSAEQQKEFDRIAGLRMADLTHEAVALLEQKYPDEDWEAYNFPSFVYTNESVEAGYMIAVKEPRELIINMCYCFCDAMGHDSLLNCFWKNAQVGGEFDDHGANCNICYGQAMLAFLWANLGASDEEIIKGMEKKFERLIKMKEKQ